MIDTKIAFENLGRGMSVASGWVMVGEVQQWICLMAASEGSGKKRTWNIIADYRPKGGSGPVRVEIIKQDCFRYEAADEAIKALIEPVEVPAVLN